MNDRPRFLVTLEALPDDVPAVVRLKKFMKAALRAYRLRCASAREVPADDGQRGPAAPK